MTRRKRRHGLNDQTETPAQAAGADWMPERQGMSEESRNREQEKPGQEEEVLRTRELTVLQQIQALYPKLSRGRKKLADYILTHSEEAAFFTAAGLGEAAGVSESTAVRFASDLGYEGFGDFSSQLAKLVKAKISVTSRMEQTYAQKDRSEILDEVLRTDMLRIEQTRQMISRDAFEEAVGILESARDIYIIGLRESAPLAQYLYFYLRLIFNHVLLVSSNSEHELMEQVLHIGPDDALVGISFPKYSLRTLRVLEFANSRQARVVTLTDSLHSPINLYASCILTAAADISSISGSMTAGMGVVDAVITALAVRNSAAVTRNLELLEKTLQDYQVSGGDEMELMEQGVTLKLHP